MQEKGIQTIHTHRQRVREYLTVIIEELSKRAETHDISKLEEPELSVFAKYGPKLRDVRYGSMEYRRLRAQMEDTIAHHHRGNRHHPEYFGPRGVNGMNLVDVIELVCDWLASGESTQGGNFRESLGVNRARFELEQQLVDIIYNTGCGLSLRKLG